VNDCTEKGKTTHNPEIGSQVGFGHLNRSRRASPSGGAMGDEMVLELLFQSPFKMLPELLAEGLRLFQLSFKNDRSIGARIEGDSKSFRSDRSKSQISNGGYRINGSFHESEK
jgi:hypothetical protein